MDSGHILPYLKTDHYVTHLSPTFHTETHYLIVDGNRNKVIWSRSPLVPAGLNLDTFLNTAGFIRHSI